MKFKSGRILAQVANVNGVLDPEVLCDMLDEQIDLSKSLAAVSSTTTSNPQDPDWNPEELDCELFLADKELLYVSASATHAEQPKGVSIELLENIWCIVSDTAKQTINTTNKLNRQDTNSKFSRNLGINYRMLRYLRIKSHLFTDKCFATNKVGSSRGYPWMQIFVSDKGYVYFDAIKSVRVFPKAIKLFEK